MTRKQLESSDVIATGTIYIIEQSKSETEQQTIIEGTAELRAEKVLQNRTALAAPFSFHFRYSEVDGCIFGWLPTDGMRAKIYLRRLQVNADDLALFYIDSK